MEESQTVPIHLMQQLEAQKNEEEARRRKLEKLLYEVREFCKIQYWSGNAALGQVYTMICDGMAK